MNSSFGGPPFGEERKTRLLETLYKSLKCDSYEKEKSPGSTFSSSCPSSVASSCDEYEESDTEFHSETSKRKIKRKILARDRDNEIDYLLKRRSLTLQRQSSNASTKSVRFLDEDIQTVKRNVSRTSSTSSIGSNSSTISTVSNSSSSSCDIYFDNLLLQVSFSSNMDRKVMYFESVTKLAKQLRSNCDKILDMSIPFVIDASLLWAISDAINDLLSSNHTPEGYDNIEETSSEDDMKSLSNGSDGVSYKRNQYDHDCMFIIDFFEQTPSLCIVMSEANNAKIQGTLDITLFRSLQFLELRKVPVHMIAGINTIRVNLKKFKCSRCISSLNEIFVFNGEHPILSSAPSTSSSISHSHRNEEVQQLTSNSSHGVRFSFSHTQLISPALSALTSVWPQLREIDVSYNHIEFIDTKVLELIPTVEILNLSRNRISSLDSSFTRVLNCLTVLNLNYNQLTSIPPLPPNLKILLLSNNYISHLTTQLLASNFKSLEVLDLSQNVISDEQQLEALHQLSSLVSLALIGNPISYSESYRTTVASNLSRVVLTNKQYMLDKKKLSNSEIRFAMEAIKKRRTSLLPTGAACFITRSTFDTTPTRLNDIKSLTQSYDSNSSSIRSACRKKAKIREVVVFDDTDGENIENTNTIVKKGAREARSASPLLRVPLNKKVSPTGSLDGSLAEEKFGNSVHETKIAIETLREKYGAENWLLRQGGCEVKKLLGISDKPNLRFRSADETQMYSKSLPQQSLTNTSFYSAITNWEATSSFDESRPGYAHGEGYNNSSSVSTLAEASHSQSASQQRVSEESIKGVEDFNNSEISDSNVFYSCTTLDGSSKFPGQDRYDVQFDDFGSQQFHEDSPSFPFYQEGKILKLIIENENLYEVDLNEQYQNVKSSWDMKSIKSLTQEKKDQETDAVQFRLQFDTLKKKMQERTFHMHRDDFKKFESHVQPYLQRNTAEDFSDGFQCIRCNAQFTKCMVTVKMIDKTPKEVSVCPNCESDMLIPLESIPLPNNESLHLENSVTTPKEKETDDNESPKQEKRVDWQLSFWRTSTPTSGNRKSETPQSAPAKSVHGDLTKYPSSSRAHKPLTRTTRSISSAQMITSSNSQPVTAPISSSLNIESNMCVVVANNNNNGDDPNVKNTKSDSDVEVLSCDSSSIEVLTRDDDFLSDVEAEEALEIFVPDNSGQLGKLSAVAGTVVMTESNSSGSFAESVCTTYEKVLGTSTTNCSASQISQQLSQSCMSPATTSLSSMSSSTTLTPTTSSGQTQSTLNTIMPIKYDYQDFTKIDHRLQLFCDITVFKSKGEELLALTKALVLCNNGSYLCLIIFSTKKIYFYKITGPETEKPDNWLQKKECFDLTKLLKVDVLIGRHSVGMDFQGGKYFALVFRDSKRTSNFFEFFLCDICSKIESPIVQDLSQIQKMLISNTETISYFGMLRLALCESLEKSYQVSAVVLTEEHLQIITDFAWLICRTGNEAVTVKHSRALNLVRQIETLEMDTTFLRIVFQLDKNTYTNWELCFETQDERDEFAICIQSQVTNVPFISLSQPLEP